MIDSWLLVEFQVGQPVTVVGPKEILGVNSVTHIGLLY